MGSEMPKSAISLAITQYESSLNFRAVRLSLIFPQGVYRWLFISDRLFVYRYHETCFFYWSQSSDRPKEAKLL